MLIFFGRDANGTPVPRPVLRLNEAERTRIEITNNAPEPHSFAIPGVPGSLIDSMPPGATRSVEFTAPQGGSYLYIDPANAPVNRLLGLHGAVVCTPREGGRTDAGAITPYSRTAHTPATRLVFDAFREDSPRFPGDPWDPARERVWVFSQIDPLLCQRAERGERISGATAAAAFRPRYFTINGLSGFDSAMEKTIKAEGYVGEPMLLRTLNAGLATHSPHIHGNHILEISGSDASGKVILNSNVIERDSWTLRPLERKDVMLPFEVPTDIPSNAWPPREEPFPLRYAMHCHIEMSQTAGGGNYPQGLVTDWELLGPTRPGR